VGPLSFPAPGNRGDPADRPLTTSPKAVPQYYFCRNFFGRLWFARAVSRGVKTLKVARNGAVGSKNRPKKTVWRC